VGGYKSWTCAGSCAASEACGPGESSGSCPTCGDRVTTLIESGLGLHDAMASVGQSYGQGCGCLASTTLSAASNSTSKALHSGECTQLYGTYCNGQGQACDCNYCDDFSENSYCANTCRIMNGFFSSPYQWNPWAAVWVKNPKDADDGTSCAWMEGSGYGGHGDDCKQCDEYAMKCRRANPPQLGATYSQNSGGNCKAW